MARKSPSRIRRSKTRRVSVTFPHEHYVALERIAERKRVSVAWVVRDAVDAYLTAETPLFRERP
ncbi:MAG: ribbon-helix-helix protein, CopG family [Phycisphaerae bacterium]